MIERTIPNITDALDTTTIKPDQLADLPNQNATILHTAILPKAIESVTSLEHKLNQFAGILETQIVNLVSALDKTTAKVNAPKDTMNDAEEKKGSPRPNSR